MRCYFHLSNDQKLLADPYGIAVTDLAMAHAEALRAIEELLQDDPAPEQDMIGWSLVVADGAGKSLLPSPRGIGAVERAEEINRVLELRNACIT